MDITESAAERHFDQLHFKLLLWKRFLYAWRDRKQSLSQILLPIIAIVVGLSLTRLASQSYNAEYVFGLERYPKPNFIPFTCKNDSTSNVSDVLSAAAVLMSYYHAEEATIYPIPLHDGVCGNETDFSKWLADVARSFNTSTHSLSAETLTSSFAAIQFNSSVYVQSPLTYYNQISLMFNTTSVHGVADFMNSIDTAILRQATQNAQAKLTTRNYPLPLLATENEIAVQDALNGVSVTFVLAFAFSTIPLQLAPFLVAERRSKVR